MSDEKTEEILKLWTGTGNLQAAIRLYRSRDKEISELKEQLTARKPAQTYSEEDVEKAAELLHRKYCHQCYAEGKLGQRTLKSIVNQTELYAWFEDARSLLSSLGLKASSNCDSTSHSERCCVLPDENAVREDERKNRSVALIDEYKRGQTNPDEHATKRVIASWLEENKNALVPHGAQDPPTYISRAAARLREETKKK